MLRLIASFNADTHHWQPSSELTTFLLLSTVKSGPFSGQQDNGVHFAKWYFVDPLDALNQLYPSRWTGWGRHSHRPLSWTGSLTLHAADVITQTPQQMQDALWQYVPSYWLMQLVFTLFLLRLWGEYLTAVSPSTRHSGPFHLNLVFLSSLMSDLNGEKMNHRRTHCSVMSLDPCYSDHLRRRGIRESLVWVCIRCYVHENRGWYWWMLSHMWPGEWLSSTSEQID